MTKQSPFMSWSLWSPIRIVRPEERSTSPSQSKRFKLDGTSFASKSHVSTRLSSQLAISSKRKRSTIWRWMLSSASQSLSFSLKLSENAGARSKTLWNYWTRMKETSKWQAARSALSVHILEIESKYRLEANTASISAASAYLQW